MKTLLLVGASLFCFQTLSATPICMTGTLASYESLGAGGCTIGTNTLASFTTLALTFGAAAIAPGAITITPMGGTDNPGLMFTFSQTASTGQTLEAIFDYMISGPSYTADMLTLSGSSETGNGDVSDVQNFCEGGSFGPDGVDGCTHASGGLVTVDGLQNMDQSSLVSPHLLSITDDIVVDSGGTGTASAGTFVDQLTATTGVPEPGTYLLLGAGIAVVALRLRKRRTAHA
jgi:PEP-CTERM motif